MYNIHQNQIIKDTGTIKEALEKLNADPDGMTLFVLDSDDGLVGTLTDGDIRRGLIKGTEIHQEVSQIMNKDFHYLEQNEFALEDVEYLRNKEIWLVPFLDKNNRILKLLKLKDKKTVLPVDTVIMAGGEGKRLRPLTENMPKPLLEVGEKPIIEHNIDRLRLFGMDRVFITVNYLGEQITNYLGNGSTKEMHISYINEDQPMGTMGSLSLIDDFSHDHILLMNSDLLTNINYLDFYKEFLKEDADITVAAVPYKVQIPYAVLETNDGNILSFNEKPTYTYYSNAGIYLLKKELIEKIPDNSFFDVTDLLDTLLSENKKITYYPILDYWLDIGKKEDFEKAQEDIKHINILA